MEVQTKIELTKTNVKVLRAGIGNVSSIFFIFFLSLLGAFLFGTDTLSLKFAVPIFVFFLLMFLVYYSSLLCKVILSGNELSVITPLTAVTYMQDGSLKYDLIKSELNKIITLKIGRSRFFKRSFIFIATKTNQGDLEATYISINDMLSTWTNKI